jgi:hypothetical protein
LSRRAPMLELAVSNCSNTEWGSSANLNDRLSSDQWVYPDGHKPLMTSSTESGKARDPSVARFATVLTAFVLVVAGIFAAASSVASTLLTPAGLFVSIGGGLAAAILIGSIGEWLVHRYFMHRRLKPYPFTLAYDLHHRAHHWIQYPPNEYVHDDRVQRVPVSHHLDRVCTTPAGRALTRIARGVLLGLRCNPGSSSVARFYR